MWDFCETPIIYRILNGFKKAICFHFVLCLVQDLFEESAKELELLWKNGAEDE